MSHVVSQDSSALTPTMKNMSLEERDFTSLSDRLIMVIIKRIKHNQEKMEKMAVDIEGMKNLKNGLLKEISKMPESNVKMILTREVSVAVYTPSEGIS